MILIYDNVKAIAEERNLSIRTLEQQAGLANGTIGGWRTSKPLAESVAKLAKVLDVPMETLMKETS